MAECLVERIGGIWKGAARKVINDVGARGFVGMRRKIGVHVELGERRSDQLA